MVNSNPLPCLFILSFAFILLHIPAVRSIGCYVCSSKNKSDINCEDPFHPGLSTYAESCKVAKKNHIGRFPSNFCVKIFGTSLATKESLMIRMCVLENMDSQCGLFKFQNDELSGCILTCSEDGCNKGQGIQACYLGLLISVLISYLSNRSVLV